MEYMYVGGKYVHFMTAKIHWWLGPAAVRDPRSTRGDAA
jgi:hypothetical protein